MSIIHIAKWKETKRKLTKSELVKKYVSESRCFITASPLIVKPEKIHIEFHGELSRIPSLKNWKLPGKNFVNPDVMARIQAMDILYQKAHQELKAPVFNFEDEPISVLCICGKRPRTFDPIGCAETVMDWLEPATQLKGRAKKPRGWGIGITKNDKHITPTVFTFTSDRL